MENKRTQLKVAMNYGTIFGLAGIAVFLVFYFMGTDIQSKLPQYISYIILMVFITIGVKSYRDEDLSGFISYGRSLGTGTLISLFGGIVSAIFTVIFFNYIAPEMTDRILDGVREKLAEQGMNEEQTEMTLDYTRKFMSPVWLFLFSIVSTTFMGFLFSLIISIFTKKEDNPFNSTIG